MLACQDHVTPAWTEKMLITAEEGESNSRPAWCWAEAHLVVGIEVKVTVVVL